MPGDIQWESFDDLTGSRDDQLVSALVIAAPQRIVLHGDVYLHYPKAVDTLQHVLKTGWSYASVANYAQRFKNIHPKGKHELNFFGKTSRMDRIEVCRLSVFFFIAAKKRVFLIVSMLYYNV